ncbi:hypothetical protein [Stakelama pacifica]|uniref:VCBS repeat protein n=1 Tax=Stakelama pacifica TaxID=517720 RepID=A0A4R6FV60_9SPHN|nr:hypothetical protein [Stakelama pacifica]TDN85723.1 hypothetical protein EV664_102433 [Stakelama pacifica]GGO91816.1 hypothetical protein GCM10011329_07390 [Stakelama pacifica]
MAALIPIALIAAPSQAAHRAPQSLQAYAATLLDGGKAMLAEADLNGDGVPEGLIYAQGRSYCGSGGCNLFVVARMPKGGYRVVTRITVARLPIRVLDSRTNGWRDLEVTVAGGGTIPAYRARLRFNGSSYPTNPSMVPPGTGEPARGEVLIAS